MGGKRFLEVALQLLCRTLRLLRALSLCLRLLHRLLRLAGQRKIFHLKHRLLSFQAGSVCGGARALFRGGCRCGRLLPQGRILLLQRNELLLQLTRRLLQRGAQLVLGAQLPRQLADLLLLALLLVAVLICARHLLSDVLDGDRPTQLLVFAALQRLLLLRVRGEADQRGGGGTPLVLGAQVLLLLLPDRPARLLGRDHVVGDHSAAPLTLPLLLLILSILLRFLLLRLLRLLLGLLLLRSLLLLLLLRLLLRRLLARRGLIGTLRLRRLWLLLSLLLFFCPCLLLRLCLFRLLLLPRRLFRCTCTLGRSTCALTRLILLHGLTNSRLLHTWRSCSLLGRRGSRGNGGWALRRLCSLRLLHCWRLRLRWCLASSRDRWLLCGSGLALVLAQGSQVPARHGSAVARADRARLQHVHERVLLAASLSRLGSGRRCLRGSCGGSVAGRRRLLCCEAPVDGRLHLGLQVCDLAGDLLALQLGELLLLGDEAALLLQVGN
mmetsp:Transcript_15094/g.59098  ORF Transcript_15094/g.59098 Transcript_15094/m.59098 type:complete len:495 (-) Transcript_15094:277-1761(-)